MFSSKEWIPLVLLTLKRQLPIIPASTLLPSSCGTQQDFHLQRPGLVFTRTLRTFRLGPANWLGHNLQITSVSLNSSTHTETHGRVKFCTSHVLGQPRHTYICVSGSKINHQFQGSGNEVEPLLGGMGSPVG